MADFGPIPVKRPGVSRALVKAVTEAEYDDGYKPPVIEIVR